MIEIDTGSLGGLSVNDCGSAFYFYSGESFTVSPRGRQVIRSLVADCDPERIAGDLADRFSVDAVTHPECPIERLGQGHGRGVTC